MRPRSIVALFVVASMSATVFADDDAATIAAARELAKEGIVLADAGKCDEAIDKLRRAEALHHAPTILERLGECQVGLGKIVDGTETLQRVVREPLGSNPPAAFVAAVERAKKVLAVATPKIAKVIIEVKSPSDAKPIVTVDGDVVPSALLGAERPTDPGHHLIEARADGYVTASSALDVAEGASAKVSLLIQEKEKMPEKPAPIASASIAPPVASSTPPIVVASPPPPRHDTRHDEPSKLPAFVALGMGAAGLVVGTTFGLLAMHHKSNLDGACDASKRCPASAQSDLDSARRDANVSTVGFGVAIVGGLVGGALLVFGPSASSSKDEAYVAPTIGFGTVGVRGAF